MKFKLLCLPVILILALAACSSGAQSNAIPTVNLGANISTPAANTAVLRRSDRFGSGCRRSGG